MTLQGKAKAVVNMQLLVHHVRLKHLQDNVLSQAATVLRRYPKHDSPNLQFSQMFQDYGLP